MSDTEQPQSVFDVNLSTEPDAPAPAIELGKRGVGRPRARLTAKQKREQKEEEMAAMQEAAAAEARLIAEAAHQAPPPDKAEKMRKLGMITQYRERLGVNGTGAHLDCGHNMDVIDTELALVRTQAGANTGGQGMTRLFFALLNPIEAQVNALARATRTDVDVTGSADEVYKSREAFAPILTQLDIEYAAWFSFGPEMSLVQLTMGMLVQQNAVNHGVFTNVAVDTAEDGDDDEDEDAMSTE